MDNIQYPVTGSSGWGIKINNNFKIISDTIGNINHKSPENFGAKGDGITDDTKAIQNAVNSGYAIDFKPESI